MSDWYWHCHPWGSGYLLELYADTMIYSVVRVDAGPRELMTTMLRMQRKAIQQKESTNANAEEPSAT